MRGFYNPGLTSIVVNQFSKHFKFDILATETEDHQLAKVILQMVSILVSRLFFC